MDFKGNGDNHLPLIELFYNNCYHSSICMFPFKALYGRKYPSPICWDDVGKGKVLNRELAQQTIDKIKVIR